MGQKVLKGTDGRKFIAAIDAMEYGVDPTGEKDSTDALQKAIDDCKAGGGGTVYLPAGRYTVRGELVIRTSVMLHGEEWKALAETDGCEEKTVIYCCYGRGTTDGMQICMEACSGLIGVTLYHPEQDMEHPVPYPPAVRQQGADSITVERVVFVNPWIGIQCGPDANELHFVKNVKMSPLFQGIFMDMTTDIGRIQGLSVSPVWYRRFMEEERGADGTHGAKLAEMAAGYMFSHATGIYMARSDWEYGYDISIEGCQTGLLVTSGQDIGPNAQFYGLKITGCETGIRMHRGNPYGIAVTDSCISSGEGTMKAAVWCDETFDSVLQCYGITVRGRYESLVCHEGKGQVNFTECRFFGKAVGSQPLKGDMPEGDALEEGSADVIQKAGGLSLLNVLFFAGGTHVRTGKNVGGTQVVGCKAIEMERDDVDPEAWGEQDGAGQGHEISVETEGNSEETTEEIIEETLLFAPERLSVPVKRSKGYTPYPYSAEPEADCLYTVVQYGAVGDGTADDTEAFEQALGEAGKTGGYVYVPGGRYRITKPLAVPEGVELRGTAEVPCHTMGGGSVIMVCCGEGDEEGSPFLSLKGHGGIRGIVLYHPWQDPILPKPYPWTVQAAGDRCYCIDTVFVNAWKGIDFGSGGGRDHYISYVSGAPIQCGIFIGRNEGGIWIENVQYNPHYWYRCDLPGRPEGDTWKAFWHNQIRYLDAFVYGAVRSLNVLNTFVFAARNGVRFVEQDGTGASGTIIGHGTDGGECGIRIDGLEDVEFVNTELVTIESPNRRIYLRNAGTGAVFYNTLMWGAPDTAVLSEEGDLKLIQANIVDSGETAIVVEGGKTDIVATHFYRRDRQLKAAGGEVRYLANMAAKGRGREGELLPPTDVQAAGGSVIEKYNWYK